MYAHKMSDLPNHVTDTTDHVGHVHVASGSNELDPVHYAMLGILLVVMVATGYAIWWCVKEQRHLDGPGKYAKTTGTDTDEDDVSAGTVRLSENTEATTEDGKLML